MIIFKILSPIIGLFSPILMFLQYISLLFKPFIHTFIIFPSRMRSRWCYPFKFLYINLLAILTITITIQLPFYPLTIIFATYSIANNHIFILFIKSFSILLFYLFFLYLDQLFIQFFDLFFIIIQLKFHILIDIL